MEEFLARELATGKLKPLGSAGGCVSATQSYETDTGKVFVKSNDDRKVYGLGAWSLIRLGVVNLHRQK